MRNIQKWQKTEKVIFELPSDTKKEMEFKELRKRCINKPDIDEKVNNPEYDNVTIMIKSATLRLFSDKLGSYIEELFNKRNRLNVISACFLVTLYNEQMRIKDNTDESIIPFELKSFWKMQKAIGLLGEVSNILMKQKLLLQTLNKTYALDNQKNAINSTLEVVNSLHILPPEDGKIVVEFLEEKFTVDANNVKLDIIPLCKILVKYYVQFVTCIDELYESFNTYFNKKKVYNARCEMEKLMEEYFTLGIKY